MNDILNKTGVVNFRRVADVSDATDDDKVVKNNSVQSQDKEGISSASEIAKDRDTKVSQTATKKPFSSGQKSKKTSTTKKTTDIKKQSKPKSTKKNTADKAMFSYEEKKAYCDEKYGEGKWYFMSREEFVYRLKQDQRRRKFEREESAQ